MRFTIALAIAVSLSSAVSLDAAERVVPTEWVKWHVNIRESPSASSATVGRLRRGEVADLLERVPLWYKIEFEGITGYVSKSWTDVVRDLDPRETDELRIHFLNIGAGTCTIVECPGANAPSIVVDCGSLGGTNADLNPDEAEAYFAGVLKTSPPPIVVISHADSDHYGWIPHVLGDTPLAHIWQGGDSDQYLRNEFPTWIAEREAADVPIHRDLPTDWSNDGNALGAELSCGDASTFILTVNTGDTSNSKSLVLLIEYSDFTVIFSGDAEGTTEATSIANFDGAVHATVLSGSHHGARSHTSNSQAWADATHPVVTVFSAGRKFFHPRCEAVRRYTDYTAEAREHPAQCGGSNAYEQVYRTTDAEYMTEIVGAVIVTTNGQSPLSLYCSRESECYTEIEF